MSGCKRAKHIRVAASLMLILVMLLSAFCFAYAEGSPDSTGAGSGDIKAEASGSDAAAGPDIANTENTEGIAAAGGSAKPDKNKGTVRTGDDSQLMLWSALFLAAFAEATILLIRKRGRY